jgi:HlyD family secretion protein
LEVRISEIDINRIQPGQAVTIRLDAVPGKEYTGEVAEVPAVGDVANETVTFAVRIKIQAADSQVRPQMTGSAQVVLESLKDVLLVPARAIRFLDGQRVIYVLKNGKPEPAYVTLGASTAEEVQVLEGELQPGDTIVINPGG